MSVKENNFRVPFSVQAIFMYLLFLGFSSQIQAGLFDSWQYKMKIVLNTGETGVSIDEAVTDFPILIRLDYTNFDFWQASMSGDDIRFTSGDDQTELSFEIEKWDFSKKQALIWVTVPVIYPQNYSQYVYMYWGNPSASPASFVRKTFSNDNHFKGVWHCTYDVDATGNGNKIILEESTHSTPSLLGKGLQFDGVDDYAKVNDDWSLDIIDFLTLSTWVKFDNVENQRGLFAKRGDGDACYGFFKTPSGLGARLSTDLTNTAEVIEPGSFIAGQWYHVAMTFNHASNEVIFYRNGEQFGTPVNFTEQPIAGRSNLYFGKEGNDDFLHGVLDEMRVESTARSADWMKLCYENQKEHQTLVTFDYSPYYDNWKYSGEIYLNTTLSGAHISSDVFYFPVVVRLNEDNFDFSEMAYPETGFDIRFTNENYLPLKYSIQKWDNAAKEAIVWVLIPQVKANEDNQLIRMFWGNIWASTNNANSETVFNTDFGHVGVWHFEDFKDQTSNNNELTNVGTNSGDGIIGTGRVFDGVDDFVATTSNSSLDLTNEITISAWAKFNSFNPDYFTGILSKKYGTNAYGFFLNKDKKMSARLSKGTSKIVNYNTPALQTDTWYYFTMVFNNAEDYVQFYLNGSPAGSMILTNMSPITNDAPLFIGNEGGDDFMHGTIDEVRLSSKARSADWIKLSYENTKPGNNFLKIETRKKVSQIGYIDGVGVFEHDGNQIPQFAYENFSEGKITYDPVTGEDVQYYIKDHLGSTRCVKNNDGQIIEAYNYRAYGSVIDLIQGPNSVREKFTGKEFDQEGGVNGGSGIDSYYFGARYYDPEVGVWLATDPQGQYWSAYTYCGNNPIMIVDPNGELGWFTWGIDKDGLTIGWQFANGTGFYSRFGWKDNFSYSTGVTLGYNQSLGNTGASVGAGAQLGTTWTAGGKGWSQDASVGAHVGYGSDNGGGLALGASLNLSYDFSDQQFTPGWGTSLGASYSNGYFGTGGEVGYGGDFHGNNQWSWNVSANGQYVPGASAFAEDGSPVGLRMGDRDPTDYEAWMFEEFAINDAPYSNSTQEGIQDFGLMGNNKNTNGYKLSDIPSDGRTNRVSPRPNAKAYRNHIHSHTYMEGPSGPDHTAHSRLGGNAYVYTRPSTTYYKYGRFLYVPYYRKIIY